MTRPWAGRRIHFLGVGGAGISAYARAAHALGASLTGSDRAEGPYLEALERDRILVGSIGHRAGNIPAGADVEVVYSSAIPAENPERVEARRRGLTERPRADLLGELSGLRRTIAVAGTHGKTTTSAMLVHALRAASMDPGWLIGAPIGAGLPNGHWSEGEWLVIEADESDRSMLSLHVEIAILTNVELDHHSSYASISELREAFSLLLGAAAEAVVWDRPQLLALRAGGRCVPYEADDVQLRPEGARFRWRGLDVQLSVPGAHNALNACGALEAARLAGAEPTSAVAGVASFAGAGRRFQRLGRSRAGALLVDDYAHHPTEVRATIAAARSLSPRRLIAVFQPHLFSRTALLSAQLGAALAEADLVAVLDVYPARERAEDHPGISGLTVAREAASHAGGRLVAWLPSFDAARQMLDSLLEEGDLCLLMGAGDIDRLSGELLAGRACAHPPRSLPDIVQPDQPLARFCTIRAGGAAQYFAKVESQEPLLELLRWADGEGLPVSIIGSGSNLLVADEGVPGLVLKLGGGLAGIEREGTQLTCGGGARLPTVAARAARMGLSGIEFAVNIPGTVGGAVRMNANAYDGELAAVLASVRIVSVDGVRTVSPSDLGFAYRSSRLRPGEIVTAACFQLVESDPSLVRERLERMRAMRHAAQPQGIKTFGSTFKNPEDPRADGASAGMLLSAAGCNGLQIGRARFAPKHANFVENLGDASTADILALMAEGRRRVLDRCGVALEPEVQLLGSARFPWEPWRSGT